MTKIEATTDKYAFLNLGDEHHACLRRGCLADERLWLFVAEDIRCQCTEECNCGETVMLNIDQAQKLREWLNEWLGPEEEIK